MAKDIFKVHGIILAKIRALPLGAALKPSSEWLSHQVMQVGTNKIKYMFLYHFINKTMELSF